MKNMTHQEIVKAFRQEANPEIAQHSSRFFKTGKGEYGEGDAFLGIRVPVTRKYARKYRQASLAVVRKLLRSKFHEERLLAVILLRTNLSRGMQKKGSASMNCTWATRNISTTGTLWIHRPI